MGAFFECTHYICSIQPRIVRPLKEQPLKITQLFATSIHWIAPRLARLGLVLGGLGLLQTPLNAKAGDSHDTTQKSETELRIGLTEAGFNQLLTKWIEKSDASARADIYFDVFEKNQFLIRRSEPKAKLRIQNRKDEIVLQKSWIDDQQTLESNGYFWSATTRTSAVDRLSRKSETKKRVADSISILSARSTNNSIQKVDLDYLREVWDAQAWPSLDSYDHGTAHLKGPVIPAAFVLKERWIRTIEVCDGRPLGLQLGRDSDILGQGRPTSYELEIEIKNTSIAEEQNIINCLSGFLSKQGLSPDQTSHQKGYDFFQRLENLFARAED